MVINESWGSIVGLSPEKLNAMTITAYSGGEISTLSSTAVDGQVVYCYASGSGYIRGHWYAWDDVLNGGTWVDLIALPSSYNLFSDDLFADHGVVIDRRSPTKEQFVWDFSGTGANVQTLYTDDSVQHVQLETGTSSTGWAAIYAGGVPLDFGQKALLKVKFRTSTGATTGQIVKIGCNIDRAGLGPNARKNFGIEWCDGDGDFQIHSGNGTSQSNFDTQIPVTTDAVWAVKILFDPGNEVKVLFDNGTSVTEKIKTTFIPNSGDSTEDGIMKISISNNAGNTTNRTLRLKAAYMVYSSGDNFWVDW